MLSRKKSILSLFSLLLAPSVAASNLLVLQSKVEISAIVVSSTCSVVIQHNGSESGLIDFGEFDKATQSGLNNQQGFDVVVYEDQSTVPGCSAFMAGSSSVSLTFGDKISGQLDEQGVVTNGAGGGIRIAIRATDTSEASNTDKITESNSQIQYSREFASNGLFGFNATVENLERASSGAYSGSLSLTVSYQ